MLFMLALTAVFIFGIFRSWFIVLFLYQAVYLMIPALITLDRRRRGGTETVAFKISWRKKRGSQRPG